MQRVKVLVDGRVQGVGYRYFVNNKATRYGIKGYVKNLPGGQVEIDAEGDVGQLREFLESCYQGPPMARVDNFHRKQVTPYGYTRFRILHHEDL
ncbi:acylphosphatase [Natronoflexus pectinivorans]|uniref:acylphosphatase n=1 Tax=Natronoflexus pectinivorans TaxID=682526 RepID=A0A4R2GPP1_9BACT|nr:acylphosphatase [Natronoflexus pectinivorans]TCO11057.1 acylphosphatase [Natronoflexus pectinivorans]